MTLSLKNHFKRPGARQQWLCVFRDGKPMRATATREAAEEILRAEWPECERVTDRAGKTRITWSDNLQEFKYHFED